MESEAFLIRMFTMDMRVLRCDPSVGKFQGQSPFENIKMARSMQNMKKGGCCAYQHYKSNVKHMLAFNFRVNIPLTVLRLFILNFWNILLPTKLRNVSKKLIQVCHLIHLQVPVDLLQSLFTKDRK